MDVHNLHGDLRFRLTQFDLSKLNVDMSQLVPSPGDMNTLVGAFKETVRGTYDGNRELLHSLCAGIGEVRLRGVCRRLSTPERAEMIDLLLPDIEATSGKSQGLVQRLMDTAPNLSTLHNTFDTIGFEKFDEGPAHKWFGERAALAKAVVHETSHGAHTVGMMDFQKISGWIRVNDLKFTDPITNVRCAISKDKFSPGGIVEAESGRYVVSEYWEAEKIEFLMDIVIENPYNTSETGYLHREGAQFVTEHASTTPEEDYAETLTMFLLDPERLGLEFQK